MNSKQGILYPLAAVIALIAALFVALDFSGVKRLTQQSYAVATVNGTPIARAEYQRALHAMQAGLERPLTMDDKNRALKILIDEELMVQEGLRLQLASDDRLIRKNLVQALINSAVLLDSSEEISEQVLLDFYTQEKSLFATPLSVTIKVLKKNQHSDVETFTQALNNKASFIGAGELAKLEPLNIPVDLPIGKIGDLLGGNARDTVISMRQGDIAGPIESPDGEIFIWLLQKKGGQLSFVEARNSVLNEWQRRQEEQALEEYLLRLRKHARITTSNPE
ncbi:MAG: peptidyl-prolyl cis-trans isomerase [Gammaproteobacteria bacterium]|nr:peptidylprolyl isomerase [Gammaproteobacteria bacterium]NNC96471.1 peptidyl-prolyl cis-trans isomerase [Gammaproteobacteria bacterium]NNM14984.1 peptidyl-prolyl cis-trans isomerase [Gammaproteobacteria bacterium]